MPFSLLGQPSINSGYSSLQALQFCRDCLLLDSRCSVFDSDYTAGTPWVVLKFTGDASKLYGSTYLRLDNSSGTIRSQYYPNWNLTTRASSYASTIWNVGSLTPNTNSLTARVYSKNELLFVGIEQTNTAFFWAMSFHRPQILRDYLLNEDNFPWTLWCENTTFSTARLTRLNQYNNNGDQIINTNAVDSRYAALDLNGNVETRKQIEYSPSRNDGIHGVSSDEILRGYFGLHPRWYTFTQEGKTYTVITPNLALRTA